MISEFNRFFYERRLQGRFALVIWFFAGATAYAQDGISLGSGVSYDASLTTVGLATDNYFLSSQKKVSASGYSLQPKAKAIFKQDTLQISASTNAEYTQWSAPGRLGDIFNYGVGTQIALDPLARHSFSLSGDFKHGNDDAGTVRTIGQSQAQQSNRLDEWQNLSTALGYRFGGDGARANSEISYSVRDRHYLTNRNLTSILDYQSQDASYTLYFNYSPKTSWLFNMARTDTRFDINPLGSTSRDGIEYRLRTGIRWQATAKTSGDVRAGYYSREPADRSNPTGGLDWSVNLNWDPRATTGFQLQTSRKSSASYRTDTQFNNDRSASVDWTQTWTSRLSSRLGYTNSRSRFVGADTNDRYHIATISAEYTPLPRLSFTASGSYLSRNSNQPNRSYDALRGDIGLRLELR